MLVLIHLGSVKAKLFFEITLVNTKYISKIRKKTIHLAMLGTHRRIFAFSKIQLVVYYQFWILIGWATTRLYVIAH